MSSSPTTLFKIANILLSARLAPPYPLITELGLCCGTWSSHIAQGLLFLRSTCSSGSRLRSCCTWDSLPHNMWDVSTPTRETELVLARLEGELLTTGPPGEPPCSNFCLCNHGSPTHHTTDFFAYLASPLESSSTRAEISCSQPYSRAWHIPNEYLSFPKTRMSSHLERESHWLVCHLSPSWFTHLGQIFWPSQTSSLKNDVMYDLNVLSKLRGTFTQAY